MEGDKPGGFALSAGEAVNDQDGQRNYKSRQHTGYDVYGCGHF